MTGSIATFFGLCIVLLPPIEARPADGGIPASEWLRRAREQAEAVEEPVARARLFGRIAAASAKLGDEASYRRDIARAKEALAAAAEKPNTSPVDSAVVDAMPYLVRARAKTGDFRGAKALVEEHLKGHDTYRTTWMSDVAVAEAEAGALDEALADIEPLSGYERSRALTQVAGVLVRRGDSRVERVVGMLPNDSPFDRDYALRAIAMAQAETGRFAEALSTLDKADDERTRIGYLADIAEIQAKSGDAEAARVFVATLPEPSRDDAYVRVARAELDRGDVPGARLTTAKIADATHRPQVLRAIAEVEARAGRFDDARRTAESIPAGERERRETFHVLAGTLARSGDIAGAVRVADDESEVGWLAEIAFLALDVNRRDEARRIVDRLRQVDLTRLEELTRMETVELLPTWLAILEARLGDATALDQLAGELEAHLHAEGDADVREKIQARLFGLYVGAGRMVDAKRLVQGKPSQTFDGVIAWVAAVAVEEGHLKRADDLVLLLPASRSRDGCVAGLALAHRDAAGDQSAAAWVKRLPTPHDRAAAYLGLTDPSLRRRPAPAATP